MYAAPALVAFMGIGPTELIIVAVIVLLLFGNRLPSVMRSLGRGVIEFKKGVQGIDDESEDKPSDEPAEHKP
jgi:sec-independent protein translocase protein TatA